VLLWLSWGCTAPSGLPQLDPTDSATALGPSDLVPLRIATWNVESLGESGSEQYEATRRILVRIDADVVGLEEVMEAEEDALARLATELGYHVVQPRGNPFGDAHNALLSRLPIEQSAAPSSVHLSGDPSANDVTRWPVSASVTAPWGDRVAVTVQHCKAGFGLDDQYRRSVDAHRLGQAALRIEADHHVAMGDINDDPSDLEAFPPSPARWSFAPGGLPYGYELGDDVQEILDGEGLRNHAFELLGSFGLRRTDARQADGREATRDSGRLIDHVLITDGLEPSAAEIYDSEDEDLPDRVNKAGDALQPPDSRQASDHFPVVVDLLPR